MPIWRRLPWSVTSNERAKAIVAGCETRTVAIWTEVRVVRGTSAEGLRERKRDGGNIDDDYTIMTVVPIVIVMVELKMTTLRTCACAC